ncbi:hypothetical protein FQN55_006764 [Onygenales sp. PD_40]|nr:hypothetical protein FQN55_006764 [Onygenales sp. PD_40]
MFRCSIDLKSHAVSRIATEISLAYTPYSQLPPDWIDPDVVKALKKLLACVLQICTWPARERPDTSEGDVRKEVMELLKKYQTNPTLIRVPVRKYLQWASEHAGRTPFTSQCDSIASLAEAYRRRTTRGGRAIQPDEMPDHVAPTVLSALKSLSLCTPGAHNLEQESRRSPCHYTREIPSLAGEVPDSEIGAPSQKIRKNADPLIPHFCENLDRENSTRIRLKYSHKAGFEFSPDSDALRTVISPNRGVSLSEVLKRYDLSTKDKIALAQMISYSFWILYLPESPRHAWTSNNIWFMQQEDATGQAKTDLPLEMYVSYDPEDKGPDLPDIVAGLLVSHRLPDILAIALLLIEIGLGQPLDVKKTGDQNSQINAHHNLATQGIEQLKSTTWKDISPRSNVKKRFQESVQNCLSYRHLIHSESSKRKKLLYNKLVKPLEELTESIFRHGPTDSGYLKCRVEKNVLQPTSEFEQRSRSSGFRSAKPIRAKFWLEDFKKISIRPHVLRKKNASAREPRPIRIAILDTGLERSIPFFCETRRSTQIKHWKDFTSGEEEPSDNHGHGTLMARLVMETAPLADVYIARVAESTAKLDDSKPHIAQAIRWAAEKEVDIISMSFGFAKDDEDIAAAIEEVNRNHKVIFMASAGNSGKFQNEFFPARHKSVISMNATSCTGEFLASNPVPGDSDHHCVFGTFGEIPEHISKDLGHHLNNEVLQPGSSVATAFAAGMVATLFTYAALSQFTEMLDDRPNLVDPERWQRLKTVSATTKMLKKMSPRSSTSESNYFVNPVWYWGGGKSDVDIFIALHDCGINQ